MSNHSPNQPPSPRVVRALDEAIRKLEAVEAAKSEPIAIVGLSCRFPGEARNPQRFWEELIQGKDAITKVPPDRWSVEEFYDPNPDLPGKMYTDQGGFLSEIDRFDAHFFGISPREAVKLDPQQRLLLEVSWEALEESGLLAAGASLAQTGVFIGATTNDYARVLLGNGNLEEIDAYYLSGNPLNAIAGRLAYTLGLQGPCLVIDTACSSSLVAIHNACQSLRNRECKQALAGGVNLILTPENTVALCKAKILAADGRCKTFDADANGIVRGEGCGVLVLKRLSDAVADQDRIFALIKGSAVNQDGASSGFTVPNKAAQEALLKAALKRAKVSPLDVDYVEAHGTGTPLGDPIELRALDAVLCAGRSPDRPLQVGSVKTNIGHLESAAGVAGVIKTILALQHQQIPPHLHLKTLNPYIDWTDLPISVTTEAIPWQRGSKRRVAGVSSFGASGTNAHVILEEAPEEAALPKSDTERPLHLLTLSAKTESALASVCDHYRHFLLGSSYCRFEDVAFTANTTRQPFKHRMAVLASSASDAAEKLAVVAQGRDIAGVMAGKAPPSSRKLAFLFTGQGSQYAGMGEHLYATQPTFRQALDHCDEILKPHLERSLLEVLYPNPNDESSPQINQTAYTQPALFAVEYALYQMWSAWGIEPDAVMGHSVGEYVAACVANVFSLEDGLKLISARGRLMQSLPQTGAMVAVLASPEQVKPLLAPYLGQVGIAAYNGAHNLVISGEKTALNAIAEELQAIQIKTKALSVSHAFHSPLMEPMIAPFRQVAEEVRYNLPQCKLVSNLTGKLVGEEIVTPEYWCQHILQPVQFASSMETLRQQEYQGFLEIGPKPTLIGMGRAGFTEADQIMWLPSLRPGQNDWESVLESLGKLYVEGATVNWSAFDRDYARQRVSLPTYPFQRQRFWAEPKAVTRAQPPKVHGNPLLGERIYLAGTTDIRFETEIRSDFPDFLSDHCVYQTPILPATAYLEMALSAGAAVLKTDRVALQQVAIQQTLVLGEGESKRLQIVLTPAAENTYAFEIYSLSLSQEEEISSCLHGSGLVTSQVTSDDKEVAWESLKAQCEHPIAVEPYYQKLRDRGLHYGSRFQGIHQLWRGDNQVIGQIALPSTLREEPSPYRLHPVLLDSCFQVLGLCFPQDDDQQTTSLPVGVEQLQVYGEIPACLWVQVLGVEVNTDQSTSLKADLCLIDEKGTVIAKVTGLSFHRVTEKAFLRILSHSLTAPQESQEDWLYQVTWQSSPLSETVSHSCQTLVIFADESGLGTSLAADLKERGHRPILITPSRSEQSDCYQLQGNSLEDLKLILESIQENEEHCDDLVYLGSLEESSFDRDHFVLPNHWEDILTLIQAVTQIKWRIPPRLWLVTKGAQAVGKAPIQIQQAPIWGLGRVIALEHPELRCTRLDLEPTPHADRVSSLAQELLSETQEDQIAYRQGNRYVARLTPYTAQTYTSESQLTIPPEPFQLRLWEYGLLENLRLVPLSRRSPEAQEVEIQVRAVGLNFRDVLNALGMLQEYTEQMGIASAADLPFGGECAGIVTAIGKNVSHLKVGDAVIAAQTIGSLSSHVIVPSAFVVLKPRSLSFEEAVTIPTSFLTAYYGLVYQANLQKGDRVLIHAAAGGVGQAAVQLAQHIGAEIFATASPGKWDFLKSQGVSHVMNSRSLDFAEEVTHLTKGEGVDVVFNSLNGEYIPKSLEVLNHQGRFIEIGKLGIWTHSQMQATRADVTYCPFDLLDLSLETPALIAKLLNELMSAFAEGSLKPLPHTVFPLPDVVSAFRYMAQAKHIGKVVISIPDRKHNLPQKVEISSDRSYLITGGLGALGFQVAQWLAHKGARNLILTNRRGLTETTQAQVAQLEKTGVQVAVIPTDVSDFDSVRQLLNAIETEMPPLAGVVHAAGVLADGMLLNQTRESFEQAIAPKVAGSWHLHSLTQNIPLDFFICFSSVSAVLGSPGQGNYAAANAFMDALAHYRQELGLPAISINWGPWAEAGMATNLAEEEQNRFSLQGIKPIPLQKGLALLGDLMENPSPQPTVLSVDWSVFFRQFPSGQIPPLLKNIAATTTPSPPNPPLDLHQQLEAAHPSERSQRLMSYVQTELAKVLNLSSIEEIDVDQGFLDLGMDSLMIVELRNRLQTGLGCTVPVSMAFDYPTVSALVNYLTETLFPSKAAAEASPPAETSHSEESSGMSETELEQLSESEAEALLMSKLDDMRY